MKTFLIILVTIVVLLAVVVGVGFAYLNSAINSPVGEGESVQFVIPQGEGLSQVADRLEAEELISSSLIFQGYLWKEGIASGVQPGSYELSPTQTAAEIAEIIAVGGDDLTEVRITIIEGLRLDLIAEEFEEAGLVDAETFLEITSDASEWDYDFLSDAPKGATLEGFLFPDTYIFSTKQSPAEMVDRMLQNFETKTEDLYKDTIKRGESFYDLVTLASIVEKEVFGVEDRKLVAGLLQNRLDIGMKLQVDVTLAYILKDGKHSHTIEETKTESPYNTYLYEGLPIGPISHPSLEALEATANPTKSDYYFFLTVPETNEVIYSRNFDEHSVAKAKYLD